MRFKDDPELLHHRWILKICASGKVWAATPDREVWKTDMQIGAKYSQLLPFSGQRMPSHIRRAQAYIDRDTEFGRFTEDEFVELVAKCDPDPNDKLVAASAARKRAAPSRAGAAAAAALPDEDDEEDEPADEKAPVRPRVKGDVAPRLPMDEDGGLGFDEDWLVYAPAGADPVASRVAASRLMKSGLDDTGDYCMYRGRGGTFGIAKRIDPADRADFTKQRSKELAEAAGRGRQELTPRGADEGAWALAIAAISRAQRSTHTRSTAEGILKEELARIGRDDPEIETFAKKAFTEAGRLRDGLSEAMSKARRAAAGGGGGGDYDERDPRVLPLVRNQLGLRHRTFAQAVDSMCESAWSDWPLSGPRTCLFVLAYIAEHYQTPEQRHARFISDGKLNHTDNGVQAHQVVMKLLYLGAVVDQLDLPQLAWAELAARHGQMVELKYKHKFVAAPAKNSGAVDPFDDAHLYLGLSSTRGALAVCPELETWVGKQLSEEYMAIKERRKAFEALKGGGGQKG